MSHEEEETQEIQNETSEKSEEETASVVEQAEKIAERIEKENQRLEKNLNRIEELRASEMLSGKSNAGKSSQNKEIDEEAEFEKEVKKNF